MHCDGCGPVAVPDAELPVVLPDVDDIRPTGTGRSPLAAAEEWVRTSCPRCGGPARRETDVSDTFVDSAWYFLRYPSTEFDDRPWDAARTARVLPVDFYAGGPEHVQRHHLYARFVTMALHDLGLVPFEEPFPRVRLGGLIAKDGAKMSKSRGNVVTPDDYVDRHGADMLRCALLFAAPWEQGGEFSDDAIVGIERFFARAWRAVTGPDREPPVRSTCRSTIDAVGAAIERLTFNVALARLMELVRRVGDPTSKRVFVRLLAPFAPHLAEELWHQLGEPFSVHTQPWPSESIGLDLTSADMSPTRAGGDAFGGKVMGMADALDRGREAFSRRVGRSPGATLGRRSAGGARGGGPGTAGDRDLPRRRRRCQWRRVGAAHQAWLHGWRRATGRTLRVLDRLRADAEGRHGAGRRVAGSGPPPGRGR